MDKCVWREGMCVCFVLYVVASACGGFKALLWALMWLEELSASWVKENLWPYEHGWLRAQPCCTYTHARTHSEMSGILPSASLTVSMASMASMVAEGWLEKEEEGEEDRKRERERRRQSPRKRERRWSTKTEGGEEEERSEGWNMLLCRCA